MDSHEKTLTIMTADWGEVIASILAPCFTVPGAIEAIAQQVRDGIALAFTADDGGGIVGAFVLRVEGAEGVIIAAASSGMAEYQFILVLLPHIEARFIGCTAIRFHTARVGLARLLGRHGYTGQEVVMRKELK